MSLTAPACRSPGTRPRRCRSTRTDDRDVQLLRSTPPAADPDPHRGDGGRVFHRRADARRRFRFAADARRAAPARGKFADVGMGTILVGLYSVPEIWVGVLMIGFLTNVFYVRWFPSNNLHDVLADSMQFLPAWGPGGFNRGWLLDTIWHLAL